MDKAQKQLIKTYYRKRGISIKEKISTYRSYEINKYSIDNKYVDLDKLGSYYIGILLENRPQLIDLFKNNLGQLNGGNDIARLLIKQPQLIDYLIDNLGQLDAFNISYLLTYQPQLKKYFNYG